MYQRLLNNESSRKTKGNQPDVEEARPAGGDVKATSHMVAHRCIEMDYFKQ